MSKSRDVSLWDAFRYIENSLRAKLDGARFPDHPTAKGDILESAWREVLRRYLPARFRVESGFVIDSNGDVSQQIDCIIYDNVFTPTFWGDGGHFHIPAEAVHAVFEIKPSVNKRYVQAASDKVNSVRTLYRTSIPYRGSGQEFPPKDLFHIIGGLLASRIDYSTGIVGEPFRRAITDVQAKDPKNRSIDVVLTAFDGFADYFDSGFPTDRSPYVESESGASTRGLFRLVRALLSQGTVGAIDLERYLE